MVKKNNRAKQRRSQRIQQQTQQQRLMGLGGLLIAGVVLALIVSATQNQLGAPVADARLELDPYLGAEDAPVTIIEYAAYGCRACQEWHNAGIVDDMLREFAGQVKFIYRDMPIITPAYSMMAAELAQCALDQGMEQFWTVHNIIFERGDIGRSSTNTFITMAAREGVDPDLLRECTESGTHRRTVQYDEQRGNQLGIRGTPTWFINGQRIYNASPQVLREAIRAALQT